MSASSLRGVRVVLAFLGLAAACGDGGIGHPGDGGGDGADEAGEAIGADAADADADGDALPDVVPDGDGGGDGTGDGAGCGATECSNCVDDDGDTLIDGFDPHCSSAADDDEASFATGIPGDNVDLPWQDCFFDGNSGSGNDGCRYHVCCLLATCPDGIPGPAFDPDTDCEVSAECIEYCLPGTTPGCDCFGCCTIYVDDVPHTVYTNPALAPDCTLDVIDDPDLCPPCTPTLDCDNPCLPIECELCPGQTIDDLPPECSEHSCDPGVTPCGTSADCPADYYCSLGCCIEQVTVT